MKYRGRHVDWHYVVEKRFGLNRLRWRVRVGGRALTSNDRLIASATQLAARLASVYALSPRSLPRTGRVWETAGLLPMRYHYYQPIVRPDEVADWGTEDPLLGIDLREATQLELLQELASYRDEIIGLPRGEPQDGSALFVDLASGSFLSGDIETLYAMVRHANPRTVIEVGCGSSTRIIELALRRNRDEGQECRHVCIEPFEAPWLERLGVEVIRRPVEHLGPDLFSALGDNDILFIDSSHVLRHGGDVKHLYLGVIPALRPGVLVHAHDIFLPCDYLPEWLRDNKCFWTEQYLLQAFLAFNSQFEVVLAVNHLAMHHRSELAEASPLFADQPGRIPGSFWFRRTRIAQ